MWRELTFYQAGNLEKTVYTNPVFGGHRDFQARAHLTCRTSSICPRDSRAPNLFTPHLAGYLHAVRDRFEPTAVPAILQERYK